VTLRERRTGAKSVETILRYSFENAEFFLKRRQTASCGVRHIDRDRAPGTAPRVVYPGGWVIDPDVRGGIRSTRNKKIGVIGIEATIQSTAYTRALKQSDSVIEVYSRGCPHFVPLVEEGWTDNEVAEMTVKAYLSRLKPPKRRQKR
jgi:glutamate racemase